MKIFYVSSKVLLAPPIKGKHVRCDKSLLMHKGLRKPIVTGTRILTKDKKDNSNENLFIYKIHGNLRVKYLSVCLSSYLLLLLSI